MPLDDPFAGYVTEAAQRFGLPVTWVRAVIAAESNGDPRARSPKGAMGLMQIMPETWADLRSRYGFADDPFEPRANILAGTAYLREMFERYGSLGFLAAYHAGPERYEDHLVTGRPLPAETRAYVAMLGPMVGGSGVGTVAALSEKPRSWTEAPLFVALKQDDDRHEPDVPARQDSTMARGKLLPLPLEGLSPGKPTASSLFVGRWPSALPMPAKVPSGGVPDGSER